ncbi:FAD-dependent monooxygenase [Nocardia otitidiscaviarum]|uniref:FAD-dependent monooxygenase n=1 Tax=Nocardia otitidiscaviarum TaxID=1823 RepID=A0A516NL64_9NOCA|nr:NAD(P)/FAD-dependent oxidoreductase [Nocardia otitidiscaviarum]MCP9619147.1 FAD-dependent monooxygenase [Nocardia otitidiscaviarum]QDP79626.1 FAD-dependent monooxygenase [Nocardia otitidiscaviarum]
MSETQFDVVIVGGRCAGATLGAMLARGGLRVCVLDKASFPSETLSTCAFQSNGVEVLRRLGVLEEVLAAGAHVVRRATITSTHQRFTVDLDPDAYGQVLGMRRTTMDAILIDYAARAGAEVRTGCPVEAVIVENGRARGVRTRSGEIRAAVVIGADGRSSTVARSVGAEEYLTRRGGRVPTWSFYEGVAPEHDFFFGAVGQAGAGSTAFLGLPLDGQFLVTVAPPAGQAREYLADRYAGFDTRLRLFPGLAAAVEGATRVGPIRVLQKWHSYFRVSAGPGWALVGDAGHFKDYSLGQGQSDAFRQAEHLAQRLIDGLSPGGDLDEELAAWWRWRDRDAWQMYWANSLLGEPHLPDGLADALFELAARDDALAMDFARIFNKKVTPLRAAAAPPRLARVAPGVVRSHVGLAPTELSRNAQASAEFLAFSIQLLARHPRTPWSRRYRRAMRPAA